MNSLNIHEDIKVLLGMESGTVELMTHPKGRIYETIEYALDLDRQAVMDCCGKEVSLEELPPCAFYFSKTDLGFVGNGRIMDYFARYTREANGYPENLEGEFGSITDVYLCSAGSHFNADDSFFTCAWKHPPRVHVVDWII